jgi:hypothetical protein
MKRLFLSIILSLLLCFNVFAASQNTSSTTAATIITQVRYVLNEAATEAEFWDDAELLRWINDGLEDIAAKAHCLENTESISLIASTIEYSIVSTTYIAVKAVHYIDASSNSIALRKGTPEMVGRLQEDWDTSPSPTFWYDWNGKIGIYPTLSSVTTETVTLYLVEMPAAVASGGTVPTPKIFDNALRAYVISRAYFKDRQYAKSGQWMAVYESEINRYRQDFIEQPKEVQ